MSFSFGEPTHVTVDVPGATLSDVATAIAGMDEAGKTEWSPGYTFTTTGDLLDSASVTVTARITLPRWRGYTTAPDRDRREWDRFYAALQDHERGHVDLVRRSLCDVDGQLVGQSPDDARQTWDAALAALKSASDAYDDDTDHGRTQGTVIDLTAPAEPA